MKLLLAELFLLVVSVASQEDADEEIECPTCVRVNTTCFNLTFITFLKAPFRNKVVIHEMVIEKRSNKLFYIFEPNITDDEYYKVGFVNLDDDSVKGVVPFDRKHIYNFGCLDIDQDNNVMYLGGSNGVFSWNLETNTPVPYSSLGDTIIDVFYKGFVYFVRYGENKIIKKIGETFEPYIPGSDANIKHFLITKNYITVYLSDRGLFLHKVGQDLQISNNPFLRGLTIDIEGNVYAWWIDGIYKVVIEKKFAKSKLVKIADIPLIGAMTFDGMNNIIFNSDRNLYKLVPTPKNTVC